MTTLLSAPCAPLALAAPVYRDSVWCMDCCAFCDALPAQSVDMILCDPPYGTTACTWDEVIPFEPMWKAFKRVIKPKGAIVLTASQPFTSRLVMSNLAWFRHEIIWNKRLANGFLDVGRKPMKLHENVLVFSELPCNYYPQMIAGEPYRKTQQSVQKPQVWGNFERRPSNSNGMRYPKSIVEFDNADQRNKVHPTQKPVDLFSYLIRTYTRPSDLVCDPTCGSGTTAPAARNTGRCYVVNDNDPHWYGVTCERLAQPYTLPLFTDAPQSIKATQEVLL